MTPLIGGIGWQEILLVAAVIFILFGASRIPAAFRSLGEGIRNFKDGLTNADSSHEEGQGKGKARAASASSEDDHAAGDDEKAPSKQKA